MTRLASLAILWVCGRWALCSLVVSMSDLLGDVGGGHTPAPPAAPPVTPQIELSGAPEGEPSNMGATQLDIPDDGTQDNQAEVPEGGWVGG